MRTKRRPTTAEYVSQMTAHLQALQLQGPRCGMELDWETTMCVISHLQLALRHPGNRGQSSRRVRGMLDALFARLEQASPGIEALLRMGDDPRMDVPRGMGL